MKHKIVVAALIALMLVAVQKDSAIAQCWHRPHYGWYRPRLGVRVCVPAPVVVNPYYYPRYNAPRYYHRPYYAAPRPYYHRRYRY